MNPADDVRRVTIEEAQRQAEDADPKARARRERLAEIRALGIELGPVFRDDSPEGVARAERLKLDAEILAEHGVDVVAALASHPTYAHRSQTSERFATLLAVFRKIEARGEVVTAKAARPEMEAALGVKLESRTAQRIVREYQAGRDFLRALFPDLLFFDTSPAKRS